MNEVITISLGAGFLIFSLGLLSAFEAHRQRKARARVKALPAPSVSYASSRAATSQNAPDAASNMASHGLANGDQFAAVGNPTR